MDTKMKLKVIWDDLLTSDEHAINDESDFFSSGGTSLKAMELVQKIEDTFGIKYSLVKVAKSASLKTMSDEIQSLIDKKVGSVYEGAI